MTLRAQIKFKNVMHSQAIALNNKATFENYNRAKNMLKSSLRNAEIQYYSHQLEIHKLISPGLGRYKKHDWQIFLSIQANHEF